MLTAVCLRAIFGTAWDSIQNHLPGSAGITSKNLLAFFIFWIVQFPVMFVHPTIIRHLFVVKAVYTTIALVGVLGWAVHMNGGKMGRFSFDGQKQLSGSALVWPMIQAINSVCAALCPILINQPDIARYATSPAQATWSQGTGILASKVLIMFLSCATTAVTTQFLGKSYWNVWDLYDAILTQYWSSSARAGIFFAGFVSYYPPNFVIICSLSIILLTMLSYLQGMLLAIIATNAGTNSLPVGADSSGLFPKYINIVRGQVICALLAPLCVPWKIIASASSFLTFLGSYTVFLMPICGIMMVDYWVVRKGNLHVPSLYNRQPGHPYTYYKGWNPRALAAWVAGVAFTVHGIAGSLESTAVNQASKNMYKLGFILSFLMGSLVYYLCSLIWPMQVYPEDNAAEFPVGFEAMAPSEGFLPGESVESITGVLDAVIVEVRTPGMESVVEKVNGKV